MARTAHTSFYRRISRHPVLVALGVVLIALIALRDGIATNITRSQLKKVPEVDVGFERLHVTLLPAGIELSNLDVYRKADATVAEDKKPLKLAHVDALSARWRWRDLLRGGFGCSAEVNGATAAVWRVNKMSPEKAKKLKAQVAKATAEQTTNDKSPQVVPKPPEAETVQAQWPEIARFVLPFRLDSLVVRNARFELHDLTTQPPVHFAVDGAELEAENLTNREHLSDGSFARVRARAKPAGGAFDMSMQLDPIAPTPTFAMRSTLKNVQFTKVNDVLLAYAGLDTTAGAFDAEVGLKCERGSYDGTIEPKVRDLAIRKRAEDAEQDTLLNRLLRTGARAVTSLLKDSENDTIATRVPLKGKFVEPKIAVWDAVTSLLANAYIEALKPDMSLASKGVLKPRPAAATEQKKAAKK